MKHRMLIILLSVCLLVGYHGTVTASEVVELEFWFGENAQFNEAMQAIVDEFNKANPGIKVNMVAIGGIGGEAYYEKIRTRLAGGMVPDLVNMGTWDAQQFFVDGGWIQDIREVIGDNVRLQDLDVIPLGKDDCRVGEYWVCMPFRGTAVGLYMNATHLDDAGVGRTEPATLADLDVLARKLTIFSPTGQVQRLGWHPVGNNWGLEWFFSFGGNYFDSSTWQPTFERPENLQALRWINSYGELYGKTGVHINRFRDQTNSMMVDSSTRLNMLINTPDLDFIIAPVPAAAGVERFSMGWLHGVAIIKGSKHPKEAAKFLLHIIDPKMQMLWYNMTYIMPVNMTTIREAAIKATDPRLRVLFNQLPISRTDPPFTYAPGGMRTIYNNAINKMLDKVLTPEAALAEMQREASLFYAPFYERAWQLNWR
ncbi:MAG TPA: extracellular solute-binding protein [Firmicutes bacterium]|nr:extracellular solute-binding protein [Bacillota bacterium]